MNYTYSFTRTLIALPDGSQAWDTDHPERVDGEGKQIFLSKEIEAAFPGWMFCLKGDNGTLDVCSDNLCPDPVALQTVVENHQNNV